MPSTVDATHTYNNGQPYLLALGRNAPRSAINHVGQSLHPVVSGFPKTNDFVNQIRRELKIRFYSRRTVKSYVSYLRAFLRWFGNWPHRVTINDIRDYLELLIDSGTSSSCLAGNLSAIRTAFDKFCGRDVTLGLAMPLKQKRQPFILSRQEVARMIAASPRRDIKLAIGLMYAAGLRNSEVCRLRVRDFDFDRSFVRVDQGKGRCDRLVGMPESFRSVLLSICTDRGTDEYIFQSTEYRARRHISPRTLQRWVEACVEITGIKKKVTPHSFRHAFATHLLENGNDIRFIQRLLGHKPLETTTIYTQLAELGQHKYESPLDALASKPDPKSNERIASVGCLSIIFLPRTDGGYDVSLRINNPQPVELNGIAVRRRPNGWLEVSFPMLESWQATINQLPMAQRERVLAPGFIGQMHHQIAERVLRLSLG